MLNIDFAPAVVGWEKGGNPRPIFDGYVVCQEHETLLREAWSQNTEHREMKLQQKRTEAILKRWNKLYRALLIKHRLQHEENKTNLKNVSTQKEPKRNHYLSVLCFCLLL
jgi:xeroderma pigmentosum group C-complementing protein